MKKDKPKVSNVRMEKGRLVGNCEKHGDHDNFCVRRRKNSDRPFYSCVLCEGEK